MVVVDEIVAVIEGVVIIVGRILVEVAGTVVVVYIIYLNLKE